MSRTMLAALGLATLAACGRAADRNDTAAADSLNRDLQLAPADSTAALNDRAATTTTTTTTTTPAPTTSTTPAPRTPTPRTTPPPRTSTTTPAPATTSTSSLAAGATIRATTNAQISSRTNKVGEIITASVTSDVKDASGHVVIPAGSTVNLKITDIKPSENKSDSTGTLALAVESVEMGGHTYPLSGDMHVAGKLVGRSTNVNDVAKVGAGAAVGAVVGRVLGGSKGTVIGGVLGGAVGAQRAVETKDRDIVVESGTAITIDLNQRFTASR